MRNIPYGRQFINEDDIEAVVSVLKSDFLTQGPKIKQFEDEFARYVGSQYAVAVSNGTAALHLSAMAMGVSGGDRVITTPITFAASANCVKYCGGEVDFVDINPETFLIDIDQLNQKLQSVPMGTYKGIISVNFTGRVVNMEQLRELADKYNCWIIEDAAHSPGGSFIDKDGNEQLSGNGKYADLSIFSFHPVKHIACGEGGMITTNDKELYEKLLLLRTHGITKDADMLTQNDGAWYYEMHELGYNYRLTDFQAALGLSQLKRADEGLNRRREIAKKYDDSFKDKSFVIRQSALVEGHAYHLYIIEVENRKELYNYLREKGIFSQVHYIPLHLMPYYKQFGWDKGDLPYAEKYYEQCLSLPMFPSLTNEEQEFVIELIINFYKQ